MPKLKLDVEALTVQTFATVAGDGRRGTVLGAGGPFDPRARYAGGGHRVHGALHE